MGVFLCPDKYGMYWNSLKRVTAPTSTIVSLDDAKAHLRVSHDDDDDYIETLIATATAYIDGPNGIGIALLPQSWRMSLDRLYAAIRLPLNPVLTVESITYTDLAGVVQTIDPAMYGVDTDQSPAIIYPKAGSSQIRGQVAPGAVKVTFTAGHEPEDLPADLRHAALLLIGHLYENREAVTGVDKTVSPVELPFAVSAILDRYRVMPVA